MALVEYDKSPKYACKSNNLYQRTSAHQTHSRIAQKLKAKTTLKQHKWYAD